MAISTKFNGAWTGVDQPFVRDGGVWKPAAQVFVKEEGVWKIAFQGDNEPPAPPVISLQNIQNRYIRVSVRMPEATNQTDIKRIRVLATVGGTTYPANPLGGGFYSAPNTVGGIEPWSDFFMNEHGEALDGSKFHTGRETQKFSTKNFVPTYKSGNSLKPSTRYNFRAWSQDLAGNWSDLSSFAFLNSAKGVSSTVNDDYTRTAVILPVLVGTRTGTSVVEGEGYVGSGPARSAYFDYGDQIRNLVGTSSTIVQAYALIARKSVDHGQPSAAQYGQWHKGVPGTVYESTAMYGDPSPHNSIAKGQTDQKHFPSSWINNLVANSLQGFELYQAGGDPVGSQAIYSSVADYPRQGALTIRWKV